MATEDNEGVFSDALQVAASVSSSSSAAATPAAGDGNAEHDFLYQCLADANTRAAARSARDDAHSLRGVPQHPPGVTPTKVPPAAADAGIAATASKSTQPESSSHRDRVLRVAGTQRGRDVARNAVAAIALQAQLRAFKPESDDASAATWHATPLPELFRQLDSAGRPVAPAASSAPVLSFNSVADGPNSSSGARAARDTSSASRAERAERGTVQQQRPRQSSPPRRGTPRPTPTPPAPPCARVNRHGSVVIEQLQPVPVPRDSVSLSRLDNRGVEAAHCAAAIDSSDGGRDWDEATTTLAHDDTLSQCSTVVFDSSSDDDVGDDDETRRSVPAEDGADAGDNLIRLLSHIGADVDVRLDASDASAASHVRATASSPRPSAPALPTRLQSLDPRLVAALCQRVAQLGSATFAADDMVRALGGGVCEFLDCDLFAELLRRYWRGCTPRPDLTDAAAYALILPFRSHRSQARGEVAADELRAGVHALFHRVVGERETRACDSGVADERGVATKARGASSAGRGERSPAGAASHVAESKVRGDEVPLDSERGSAARRRGAQMHSVSPRRPDDDAAVEAALETKLGSARAANTSRAIVEKYLSR